MLLRSQVTTGDSIYYKAEATVNCQEMLKIESAYVSCTFTNYRAKVQEGTNNKTATVEIPIINSKFWCPYLCYWLCLLVHVSVLVRYGTLRGEMFFFMFKCPLHFFTQVLQHSVPQKIPGLKLKVLTRLFWIVTPQLLARTGEPARAVNGTTQSLFVWIWACSIFRKTFRYRSFAITFSFFTLDRMRLVTHSQSLSSIKEISKGLGFIRENADHLITSLKTITTTDKTINSYANINSTVDILKEMNQVSEKQLHKWNDTIMPVSMFYDGRVSKWTHIWPTFKTIRHSWKCYWNNSVCVKTHFS